MILIWDNLAGHRSDNMVSWLFAHGIMLLYTPLGGSWLNMAESMQRILVRRALLRRALSGQDPQTPQQIIDWLEQTVAGWNQDPTPFIWNGKRRERRQRARLKRLVHDAQNPWVVYYEEKGEGNARDGKRTKASRVTVE